MKGRKRALLLSLFLLAGAGALFLFCPYRGPDLQDNVCTARMLSELKSSRQRTEEAILSALYFQGEPLPFDRESGTFYLPLHMDEEKWESGRLYSGTDGVEIYLLEDPLADEKQEAIRQGKAYALLAVKENVYREYQLVFTGLPMLCIETPAEIRYEEVYGSMAFYQAETKENWVLESLMSGHIRGGSSRLNPKKSYKMTLYKQNQTGVGQLRKNQVSLLNMRTDDEWILYSLYSEDSKVRDKLCLDIWNASGALNFDGEGHFGYHMEYIEVIMNGRYYGIYGLMEPIDYKQLQLTKEGEAQPEDFLYKQKDPGVFELKGNHPREDATHWEPLETYQAYLEADDSVFAEEMPRLIDVDNALDVWIYLQAVLGMDNIERNIFYPALYENGGYRIHFVPWDMDYSWGNVHDFDALNRTRFSEEILTMRIAWKLGDRLVLLDVDNAREKVAVKWKELRKTVYSEQYLTEQIDSYAHTVLDSGAFHRDVMWYDSMHNSDYDSLKRLACERVAFLDYYMEHLEEYLDLEAYVE